MATQPIITEDALYRGREACHRTKLHSTTTMLGSRVQQTIVAVPGITDRIRAVHFGAILTQDGTTPIKVPGKDGAILLATGAEEHAAVASLVEVALAEVAVVAT